MKVLAKNRRAYFDYEITEKLEAGVVLTGQEVKSAKTGGLTLTGSYARVAGGEVELLNAKIKPYALAAGLESYDASQTRKLLLHKAEIYRLSGRTQEKGLTLLPLEAYTKKGKIKILLGLGRAKKKTDKRETIKKREDERKIQKIIRSRRN
ncbi:MAG: SsrA-binding protein SmpB [Patescibacteria group bacterium]